MFRELESIRKTLLSYIESAYHLSHPHMVALRRQLLEQPNVICQSPYLESSARYRQRDGYLGLNIPSAAAELSDLSKPGTEGAVFGAPFTHQAAALEAILGDEYRHLIVTTGTGSGKTETFLLPILGRLAREAAESPASFKCRAVRALLLYPMNALVNDQLTRLRRLFGNKLTQSWFVSKTGRPAKFGRYTSRTAFPGIVPDDADGLRSRLECLRFFTDLEDKARNGDKSAIDLMLQLERMGKWPGKVSATDEKAGLLAWYGRGSWFNDDGSLRRTIERLEDTELLVRHEIQAKPPDLLVTNYSMLEYMMLRPIERSIFRATKEYFEKYPLERFILVLDEAHLYRGAQGTEVALLIRRLRHRLGLSQDQFQVITTSASFEDTQAATQFAAGLTGTRSDHFVALNGEKVAVLPSGSGTTDEAECLSRIDLTRFWSGGITEQLDAIRPLFDMVNVSATVLPTSFQVAVFGGSATPIMVRLRGMTSGLAMAEEIVEVPQNGIQRTGAEYLAVVDAIPDDPRVRVEVGPLDCKPEWIFDLAHPEQASPSQNGCARLIQSVLAGRPVTGRLLNLTSGTPAHDDPETAKNGGSAQEINALSHLLFPDVENLEVARRATDSLVELASFARRSADAPPLMAARVHRFFRGVAGIWACSNSSCSEIPIEMRGKSPTGQLFVQPRRTCGCGARVFELHTCRFCGTPVLLAWTLDPRQPTYLWQQNVGAIDDVEGVVVPMHLWLEDPLEYGIDVADDVCREFDLDPVTGRLFGNSEPHESTQLRQVWLPPQRRAGPEAGLFDRCPRCHTPKNPISDLTTKGDEPFQNIITAQLLEQPARREVQTPLKGRKLLVFSDGRQPASRLAGKLKDYSLRDSVRPLLLAGLRELTARWWVSPDEPPPLKYVYAALLAGAITHDVTLSPQLRDQESDFYQHVGRIRLLIHDATATREAFQEAAEQIAQQTPRAILLALYEVLFNAQSGLQAVALGKFVPRLNTSQAMLLNQQLPAPDMPIGLSEDQRRLALLEFWTQLMVRARAIYLPGTPADWIGTDLGARLRTSEGKFQDQLAARVGTKFYRTNFSAAQQSGAAWRNFLSMQLGVGQHAGQFLLNSAALALKVDDKTQWYRCRVCTSVHPGTPLLNGQCITCDRSDTLLPLNSEQDEVFLTRKGLYREAALRLKRGGDGWAPHPFVAEEHTAAIGAVDAQDAFSRAEWHEMRFQDIEIPGPAKEPGSPVDVLSCTTTMEVGIDIGSLTAVALRNVPPNRANYQQRAGRAGRRGSSLSTVMTYADQGSHDQRYFRDPAAMISGPVTDPILNLDNEDIVRRHGYALLLTLFQQERITDEMANATGAANVFAALGRVKTFREGDVTAFSYRGLQAWMGANSEAILTALESVFPSEYLERHGQGRLASIPDELLRVLQDIGAGPLDAPAPQSDVGLSENVLVVEEQEDAGFDDGGFWDDEGLATDDSTKAETPDTSRSTTNLLDLLFDRAVLPSYAFPTDVVSMTVFDRNRSDNFRAVIKYAPQRGLGQALSSYAPGREVFIDGLRHYSFALWTPNPEQRHDAWDKRELYFECDRCGYAEVVPRTEGFYEGELRDCPACKGPKHLGPAIMWMTPPGFAHPCDMQEDLAVEEPPDPTRPTQAKLSAAFDEAEHPGEQYAFGDRGFTKWAAKETLFLTNRGSLDVNQSGFLYCCWCGRIEPNAWRSERGVLNQGLPHTKPYPNCGKFSPRCRGKIVRLALGTKFPSDVVLFRLRFDQGVRLRPGSSLARITLTTLAQVLCITAADLLEIDRANIGAEFRPAMTAKGHTGEEADVYLYDTTSGGAGFVRAAAADPERLMQIALRRLEDCNCNDSCYQCLRTYENRFLHADLDRTLCVSVLKHILNLEPHPQLDRAKEDYLLNVLGQDLRDSGEDVLLRSGYLELPNRGGRRVVLANALSPDQPGSDRAANSLSSGAIHSPPVDHIKVERALPAAVRDAIGALVNVPTDRFKVPPFLKVTQADGVPVFMLEDLTNGWANTTPRARVNLDLSGVNDPFVLSLDGPYLERFSPSKEVGAGAFVSGTCLVFSKNPDGQFRIEHNKSIGIVHRAGEYFRASKLPVTIGFMQGRKIQDRKSLNVSYRSPQRDCVPQSVDLDGAEVLGQLVGYFHMGAFQKIVFRT